jgi:hypothetical protein
LEASPPFNSGTQMPQMTAENAADPLFFFFLLLNLRSSAFICVHLRSSAFICVQKERFAMQPVRFL